MPPVVVGGVLPPLLFLGRSLTPRNVKCFSYALASRGVSVGVIVVSNGRGEAGVEDPFLRSNNPRRRTTPMSFSKARKSPTPSPSSPFLFFSLMPMTCLRSAIASRGLKLGVANVILPSLLAPSSDDRVSLSISLGWGAGRFSERTEPVIVVLSDLGDL